MNSYHKIMDLSLRSSKVWLDRNIWEWSTREIACVDSGYRWAQEDAAEIARKQDLALFRAKEALQDAIQYMQDITVLLDNQWPNDMRTMAQIEEDGDTPDEIIRARKAIQGIGV